MSRPGSTFNHTDSLDILRGRLLDLLVDDEEYLEELYLHCNYKLEDAAVNGSIVGYPLQFRLSSILCELDALGEAGLVRSRVDPGWPLAAEPAAVLYSLTDAGRAAWAAEVQNLSFEQLYLQG